MGWTVLHYAVFLNRIEYVRAIVDKVIISRNVGLGGDHEQMGEMDSSHEVLIKSGMNEHKKSRQRVCRGMEMFLSSSTQTWQNPLMIASSRGYLETVVILLSTFDAR